MRYTLRADSGIIENRETTTIYAHSHSASCRTVYRRTNGSKIACPFRFEQTWIFRPRFAINSLSRKKRPTKTIKKMLGGDIYSSTVPPSPSTKSLYTTPKQGHFSPIDILSPQDLTDARLTCTRDVYIYTCTVYMYHAIQSD